MARSPGHTPAFARAFFAKGLDISDPGFSHRPRWDTTSSIKHTLTPELREEMRKGNVVEDLLSRLPDSHQKWDPLCRAQWLEMVTLLSGYILSAQGDRMLMANSVEGRFPFLDCGLVDFANQLPARHKLLALDEKHLLKIAFSDLIPKPILERPKQPYRAPDAASFFYKDNLGWVGDLTNEAAVKKTGIFIPDVVSRLTAKCRQVKGLKMSNTDNMRIVAILSTLLLHHQYIDQDGGRQSDERPPEPMKIVDKVRG
jgi:asparagine synthase (glutamine-hydrolysing)